LNVEGIESYHPLMTFGPAFYDLEFYEKIYFAVPSKEKFRARFPKLSNPVFELKAQDKAFYHALCVMSGNFPQILWRKCLSSFDKLGVPAEAVTLYLQKNLENFSANPSQSLTGPLVRKDRQTIRSNIDALPEPLKKLYSAFVEFYLPKS
jgi:2-dehydropantoate 2-reductase